MIHALSPEYQIDKEEFKALRTAIEAASKRLLLLWPGHSTKGMNEQNTPPLNVQTKSDGSLVSQADYESNEILTSAIKTLFPSDQVVSEEGVGEGEIGQQRSGRRWIIDPLDGTSSFLHGRDDFSILVGCWYGSIPLLGIMRFPVRDLWVTAQSGAGCTINGEVAQVSSYTTPRAGHVYIRNFNALRSGFECTPRDSGLALMQVANGELDGAVIKMTSHKIWDVAAPIVAIREAGGKVTDEHGVEIECGLLEFDHRYVVASNTKSHQEILTLVDS